MKKLALTIAIILGLGIGAIAQEGGIFGKGPDRQSNSRTSETSGGMINLPGAHSQSEDSNAAAPLGSGVLLLVGLGAAYALRKKNEK